jgi:hypothetical protein
MEFISRPDLCDRVELAVQEVFGLTPAQAYKLNEALRGVTLMVDTDHAERPLARRAARLAYNLLFGEHWQEMPVSAALVAGFVLVRCEGGLALDTAGAAAGATEAAITRLDAAHNVTPGTRYFIPSDQRWAAYWPPVRDLYSVHCVCERDVCARYRGVASCHDGALDQDLFFPIPSPP